MEVRAPLAAGLVIIAGMVLMGAAWFVRKHELELEAEAERALPWPLRPVHRFRDRTVHGRLAPGSKSQ